MMMMMMMMVVVMVMVMMMMMVMVMTMTMTMTMMMMMMMMMMVMVMVMVMVMMMMMMMVMTTMTYGTHNETYVKTHHHAVLFRILISQDRERKQQASMDFFEQAHGLDAEQLKLVGVRSQQQL